MKTSFAVLAIALSGSAMGAPFSNGTRIASSSSPVSTPAHLSTDPPLPNPFASSSKAPPSSKSVTFSRGTIPSGNAVKRGEALSIPTDLPSLASDAQSVAAALASAGAGAQKRGEELSLPTDLPSLVSDAQSAAAALASVGAGAQKRGEALSLPTDLPSLVSDASSAAAALASAGAQKRGDALSLPTDLPSLVSDAESAAAALASAGAQKRDDSLSIPTDIPSLLSDAQSVGAALASAGGQKRAEQTIPILTPTGLPTPSSTLSTRPAPSASSHYGVSSASVTPSTPSSSHPLPTATGGLLSGILG